MSKVGKSSYDDRMVADAELMACSGCARQFYVSTGPPRPPSCQYCGTTLIHADGHIVK